MRLFAPKSPTPGKQLKREKELSNTSFL